MIGIHRSLPLTLILTQADWCGEGGGRPWLESILDPQLYGVAIILYNVLDALSNHDSWGSRVEHSCGGRGGEVRE
jgi:hypothetical protein